MNHDELRRLADAAWPGPWEKFGNTVTLKARGKVAQTITLPGDHQTIAFIAAARSAVPALLDEVEQLREALTNLLTALTPDDDAEMVCVWTENRAIVQARAALAAAVAGELEEIRSRKDK